MFNDVKLLINNTMIDKKYHILWGLYRGSYVFCTNINGYMRNAFISNAKTLELAFNEYKQELLNCGFNV